MRRGLPELIDRTDLERIAESIENPIERLRYIRQATSVEGAPNMSRRRLVWSGVAAVVLPFRSDVGRSSSRRPAGQTIEPPRLAGAKPPNVWPVEQNDEYDLYSNGLRIENRLAVANTPRSYVLLSRDSEAVGPRRSQPAGIVFHTTESDQAPFDQAQKVALRRIGREVLLFVRNKRAYHFVIDRFGRVHRIVVESDSAFHAGHSIWADSRWLYLDLNASFLGVSFEARTQGEDEAVTGAQIRAARALTDVLRARYKLPAGNCVTHAQVSVNPSNMRIGWHTDWADRFPFRDVGLPDNYEIPSPSLYCFGFEYDSAYVSSSGPAMRRSLAAAEERLRGGAAARGLPVDDYRRVLQQKYRKALATVRDHGQAQENDYEQDGNN